VFANDVIVKNPLIQQFYLVLVFDICCKLVAILDAGMFRIFLSVFVIANFP